MNIQAELEDPEMRVSYGVATLKYDIAAALVAARKRKNLSQAALATMAGVSHASMAKLESGEGNPTLSRVGALFAALGVRCRISTAPLLATDMRKGNT